MVESARLEPLTSTSDTYMPKPASLSRSVIFMVKRAASAEIGFKAIAPKVTVPELASVSFAAPKKPSAKLDEVKLASDGSNLNVKPAAPTASPLASLR